MLPIWYNEYKKIIEESILEYLMNYFKNNISNPWLNIYKEWVFYATKWWKRIRSILALEFYIVSSWKQLNDINFNDDILKYCIALEFIHSFSLIHDDLPCIDNDDYRRWELTVWKKYWESTWVLIWDLLNTLSFEIISDIENSVLCQKLIKLLSHSIWFYWMIWWQVDDLYFEKNFNELNIKSLKSLHNKKTWALIRSSILWWIILSQNISKLKIFDQFWKKLWLAFQIKDDLLDYEWTFEETGKSVWWEEKWFVYFLWIEKTKQELNKLLDSCLLEIKGLKSEKIEFLVKYIWDRKK